MSRPKLPPRLVLRADRSSVAERAAGIERHVWVIKDGDKFVRTGCREHETEAAGRRLAAYIGEKHEFKWTSSTCRQRPAVWEMIASVAAR